MKSFDGFESDIHCFNDRSDQVSRGMKYCICYTMLSGHFIANNISDPICRNVAKMIDFSTTESDKGYVFFAFILIYNVSSIRLLSSSSGIKERFIKNNIRSLFFFFSTFDNSRLSF